MASHGTRVFVLGGETSEGPQVDDSMLIHVLDTSTYFLLSFHLDSLPSRNTEHIKYPKLKPNAVDPSEKTTQLVRKSSVDPPADEQPQHPMSSSGAFVACGPSPSEKATSLKITCEESPDPNDLPPQLAGRSTSKLRCAPESSCVGLWNLCGLRKPKSRRRGGTRKA